MRLIAEHAYGIDELTGANIASAQEKIKMLRRPGERFRLLHDVANLDHTQTDDKIWLCAPDSSGLDFFLYDLSWRSFCNGEIELEEIHAETGIEVVDLKTLKQGIEANLCKTRSYRHCSEGTTRLQSNPQLDRTKRC